MTKRHTEAEQKAWLASQPAKPISAKLIARDSLGKILAVKPTYKDGLDLPGGVVEKNESPLAAVIREAAEEIGIKLEEGRVTFAGLRYGYSKSKDADYLHILFTVSLTDDEIANIRLDPEECESFEWIDPSTVTERLSSRFTALTQNILHDPGAARYSDQDRIFL